MDGAIIYYRRRLPCSGPGPSGAGIERQLIATASAEGWLLAMRWFPKSFAQIASALVMPLGMYSKENVVTSSDYAFVPGMQVTAHFREGDEATSNYVAETLRAHANETATNKAFSGIFHARILDFARLVPKAFVKPVYLDEEQLTSRNVFPSWDLDLVRELVAAGNRLGLLNLCRVWSVWSIHLARVAYTYGVVLLQSGNDPAVKALDCESSIELLGPKLSALPQSKTAVVSLRLNDLTFSVMATDGYTIERGFFAALLCFCSGVMRSHIKKSKGIAVLADLYGELEALGVAADALAASFRPEDHVYVREKAQSYEALLTALEFIQIDALDELARTNPSLRCLSEPLVEPWSPQGNPPPYLGKAMGFAT